ncbi:purine nucleoside permease [[Candida] anglica]|uniref:Purine nucleoside permease n=1 Tax=[Candida] anglica TaxID=148631 RepID=A0ABP0EC18_9ASCO
MRLSTASAVAALAASASAFPLMKRDDANSTVATNSSTEVTQDDHFQVSFAKPFAIFQPKVFIGAMFSLETAPWLEALDFVHNITLPGLSPQYPDIHCTTNYSICQFTAGEGEINAAASVTALALSPLFDLSKTYFLLNGIAGGEPDHTTLGSVTFAKYAVQAALEYEIDPTEFTKAQAANWTSGYFAFGTNNQQQYPGNVYGTEVFELNENLRNRAIALAKNATLDNGTTGNAEYRKLYPQKKARALPGVEACDVLTSDVYFTGNVLGDYFSNFTKLMTNGSATYCSTAQEDNASLEALVRADKHGLVDYDRIVVMRTISDFARPPPSMANDTLGFFTNSSFGGISASVNNLVNAGLPFVTDVVQHWDKVYKNGTAYKAKNYVGDIFGTLGGVPDFGLPSFEIA